MKTYRVLELDVIRWAEDRKIIPNSTPFAQISKLGEEFEETLDAARRLKMDKIAGVSQDDPVYQKALDDFRDGIGDCVVCLINACALADVDLVDCLNDAYNEIKDRKGTMNEDGIFVKE